MTRRATSRPPRRRCACRGVLLELNQVELLEQVGVDPTGPRTFVHRLEGCGLRGPRLVVAPAGPRRGALGAPPAPPRLRLVVGELDGKAGPAPMTGRR